jgi:hypothetical protein
MKYVKERKVFFNLDIILLKATPVVTVPSGNSLGFLAVIAALIAKYGIRNMKKTLIEEFLPRSLLRVVNISYGSGIGAFIVATAFISEEDLIKVQETFAPRTHTL